MREVLFIPLKDKDKEFWVGKRIGYSDDLSDLKRANWISIHSAVDSLLEYHRTVILKKRDPFLCLCFFFPDYQLDHNARFALEMGT